MYKHLICIYIRFGNRIFNSLCTINPNYFSFSIPLPKSPRYASVFADQAHNLVNNFISLLFILLDMLYPVSAHFLPAVHIGGQKIGGTGTLESLFPLLVLLAELQTRRNYGQIRGLGLRELVDHLYLAAFNLGQDFFAVVLTFGGRE